MSTPNNLPAELTSFVGREPQLAELRRLLRRSRLTTLTGPGGAGKTRLALRLATESLDRYPNGVWLLDLAPIGDGRLLEQTLAGVAGVKEETKRPIVDLLSDALAQSRCLIVLDGCEHLVDECAVLTNRLLRACPKLTIIATSREPLGVSGEVTWRTPSLTIPRPEDAAHPELLLESESIRLFVDRARLSRPDFRLETPEAPAMAQICARLEGIPLAIELAAGLAGVMTLEEILDRLSHRFRLLTGGGRSSLPRHQTLRQAVDWSYGLLTPTEQALFARLGVFAGGFDLSAVESVTHGDPISADEVLPILSRLVHKSLVVAESARPHITRYRMLDTIREYAQEKLQQSGEAEWRTRHSDYFTNWITSASVGLNSMDQMAWLQRCDEEQANLRLALEWSLSEQPDNALRLVAAMGTYWWMRRSLSEGFDWITRALDVKTSNAELRAAALVARARLSRRRGDYATAERDAEEGAAIARRQGLDAALGQAVTMLGIVASHSGDYGRAVSCFDEARVLAEQSGDRGRRASSLNNLALIKSAMGDHDGAFEDVQLAAAIVDESGNRFLKANILDTVARIHFRRGNLDVARRKYEEALAISAEFQDTMNIADCLEGVALLALSKGDPARMIVLTSAADAMRSRTGAERTVEWSQEVVEAEGRARAGMPQGALEAAQRQGAAMSVEEAVAFALGQTARARHDGSIRLTGRESEVARLIAGGLTNGEIAARLRISERTVDAHVEHIRNKLGLRTRTQIAVWAKERLGTA